MATKACADCSSPMVGAANARKRCDECAARRVAEKQAEYARNRRAGRRAADAVCRDCGSGTGWTPGRGRPPHRCVPCRQGTHPQPRDCARCGESFTPNTSRGDRARFCSKGCRDGHRDRLLRAKLRGGELLTEPYSREQVFERDGWRCGICGDKISKSAPYPDPRAATVDHIIPLSRGGHDLLVNVQAAHWGCNRAKRNKAVGSQLRLVG